MLLFSMSHKAFFPWIRKFILADGYQPQEWGCSVCNGKWCSDKNEDFFYNRPLDALIEISKGSKWTDIIGNGSQPYFTIVSQRVLEIWEAEGIGKFPAFPIRILPPYPRKLTTTPPIYYRLDYQQMEGAELDLEASGFLNAKKCNVCGQFSFNWLQSDRFTRHNLIPYKLKEETWNGANVFRPKYPVGFTFCTERVVDCATKHKMTNFRFIPFEIGDGLGGDGYPFGGVDYSTKSWREKMKKQIEDYRKNFRTINHETVRLSKNFEKT
jgi:hypothetical protein